MPLRRALIFFFALILTAAFARADDTSLTISSDAGDLMGLGQNYAYVPGDYRFVAQANAQGTRLSFDASLAPASYPSWTVNLDMPAGRYLLPGRYAVNSGPDSVRLTLFTPMKGYLYWEPQGFVEISTLALNAQFGITALVVGYELHQGGAAPALRGEYRFHADAPDLRPLNWRPNVTVGANATVYLPAPVKLDGAASDDGLPAKLLTTWSMYSGPAPVEFADPHDPQTTVTFGAPGSYMLQFEGNDGDLSQSGYVTYRVLDPAIHHLFRVLSKESRYYGPGSLYAWTAKDFDFVGERKAGGAVSISILKTDRAFEFSGPDGLPLSVGEFPLALTAQAGPGEAKLTGYIPSSPTTGRLVVRELTLNEAGGLVSFWATFVFGSPAGDADVGEIQFNAGPDPRDPRPPLVTAGLDQTVSRFARAALFGRARAEGFFGGSTPVMQWSKVSGPGDVVFRVNNNINDVGGMEAALSKPGTYVLRLTAQEGPYSASDDITVIQGLPETSVVIRDLRTDPTTAAIYHEASYPLTASVGNRSGSLEFKQTGAYQIACSVRFSMPFGQKLAVGKYSGATAAGLASQAGSGFGLELGAEYLQKADFEIKELVRDAAGKVTSLWLTFVAEGGAAGKVPGEVRFNSEVPNPAPNRTPAIVVSQPGVLPPGVAVTLRGAIDDDALPAGSALQISWSQLSGPDSARFVEATTRAPRVIFPSAGMYRLRAAISDGALSSSQDFDVVVSTRSRTFGSVLYEGAAPVGLANVTLLANGQFTARFNLGTVHFPIVGKLINGRWDDYIDADGETISITLILESDQLLMRGWVSVGTDTIRFSAPQNAAGWLAGTGRVSAHAGRHTFGLYNNTAGGPRGAGFGTLTIGEDARFKLAGVLASGTPWSQAGTLSISDEMALFGSFKAGRENVAGLVKLRAATAGALNVAGQLRCAQDPMRSAARFGPGFETTLQFAGGRYLPPAKGQNALSMKNSTLAVELGAGPDEEAEPIVLFGLGMPVEKHGAMIKQAAGKFTFQLAPATGLFRGGFKELTGKMRSYRGVLLQPVQIGIGFYLDETKSGIVGLQEAGAGD